MAPDPWFSVAVRTLALFSLALAAPLSCKAAGEAGAQVDGDDGLAPEEQKVISIFEKSAPSVVFVTNKTLRRPFPFFDAMEVEQGKGSGFIWDRDGHIVTNFHVIEGAGGIAVTLADGSSWDAAVVGAAPEKELAVIKIDAPRDRLVPIEVGSSANLKVGQTVLAIGNPFGLDHTLTKGIVSARGREIKSMTGRVIRDVIQTDAAINPGNSGGPLIDSHGRLVGINTAIVSPSGASSGIGFAVPADIVKRAVPQLIRYGKLVTPDPGVVLFADAWIGASRIKGAVIRHVLRGSPAAEAGLEGSYETWGQVVVGDIIVGVAGAKVESADDYFTLLEKYKPGEVVKFTIKRGRALFEVEIPLISTAEE